LYHEPRFEAIAEETATQASLPTRFQPGLQNSENFNANSSQSSRVELSNAIKEGRRISVDGRRGSIDARQSTGRRSTLMRYSLILNASNSSTPLEVENLLPLIKRCVFVSEVGADCLLFANFALFDLDLQYPGNVNALVAHALLCVSQKENMIGSVSTGFDQCFEMLKNFGFLISGEISVVAFFIQHNRVLFHSHL
jgi:hypothetical protein